jgi:transcriptional regulator with XRE-family HTH domain
MGLRQQFGSNLRHYRKARDLNQDRLAEALELSTAMVSKMERGEVAPSFETIEKIAGLFGIDEAALFSIGIAAFPPGERGRLLQKINAQLGKLNESDLARASRMIGALKG